jgi:hypothetical protein
LPTALSADRMGAGGGLWRGKPAAEAGGPVRRARWGRAQARGLFSRHLPVQVRLTRRRQLPQERPAQELNERERTLLFADAALAAKERELLAAGASGGADPGAKQPAGASRVVRACATPPTP